MGLFGDFFDDPMFDFDGNGNVDSFEEMLAFDLFLNDPCYDEDDDFDSDDEDLFDDDDDIFDD